MNVAVVHLDIQGVVPVDAHGAAAIEVAVFHQDALRIDVVQHTAHAVAQLLGVTDGKVCHIDIGAVFKGQNVRVSGHSADGPIGPLLAGAPDGEIAEVLQDQLRPVEGVLPAVVLSAGFAVVCRLAQVQQSGIHHDLRVRGDGVQEFIHGGYMHRVLLSRDHRVRLGNHHRVHGLGGGGLCFGLRLRGQGGLRLGGLRDGGFRLGGLCCRRLPAAGQQKQTQNQS